MSFRPPFSYTHNRTDVMVTKMIISRFDMIWSSSHNCITSSRITNKYFSLVSVAIYRYVYTTKIVTVLSVLLEMQLSRGSQAATDKNYFYWSNQRMSQTTAVSPSFCMCVWVSGLLFVLKMPHELCAVVIVCVVVIVYGSVFICRHVFLKKSSKFSYTACVITRA